MESRITQLVLVLAVMATVTRASPAAHGRPSHRNAQQPDMKYSRQTQKRPETDQTQHKNSVPWEVCFYTNWAQYRAEPGTFFPEDIDVSLCSHIFFAFANMDGNSLVPYEPNDVDMFQRINRLKLQKPTLMTSLAVGGWTFGTAKMTLMMSSRDNRTEFINSVITVLREHNFNGVDLDFEYPASRGSPAIDKAQFTCLLEEMRVAFMLENPSEPLLLTAGVAAGMENVPQGYDIARVCDAVDKVNLMSYDFFGSWDNSANPNAPLYPRTGQSTNDRQKCVEFSAEYWNFYGCPKHKMNIGVSTYGRSFTLTTPFDGGMGAPISGKGDPGRFTLTAGILNYYEICEAFFPSATIRTHPEHMVPWANLTDQWVGYEDRESLIAKGNWIKDNGYGGFMLWSLDHDDFTGQFCNQGPYPLLSAIHQTMDQYIVPDDPVVAPNPIPDPNMSFCQELDNGYYADRYTCSRCYQCLGGLTQVLQCGPGEVMNPVDLPNCRPLATMTEEDICLECYEFCDCSTVTTPLSYVQNEPSL